LDTYKTVSDSDILGIADIECTVIGNVGAQQFDIVFTVVDTACCAMGKLLMLRHAIATQRVPFPSKPTFQTRYHPKACLVPIKTTISDTLSPQSVSHFPQNHHLRHAITLMRVSFPPKPPSQTRYHTKACLVPIKTTISDTRGEESVSGVVLIGCYFEKVLR